MVLRNLIIILGFAASVLFSSEVEATLYDKLFTTLFSKKLVKIYTINPDIKKLRFRHLMFVKNCSDADVIIGQIEQNCTKPVFVLDFKKYKEYKDAIGAFYWRKGRPQLRLREKAIKKYHLKINDDFKDFIDDLS